MPPFADHRWPHPLLRFAGIRLLPGLSLVVVVAAVATHLARVEERLLGRQWLEPLVLAILLGTAIRTIWSCGPRWQSGLLFGAKYPLEIAVVLLGASVSARTLLAVGPALLVGIAGVVVSAILLSFAIGKLLRLPTRMALLVACGNSICGNSAIAAVAPVIGADGDDVAASIAFTAVFGVAVVLGLPLLGTMLGMTHAAYGAFAGLTVYAVPQVLAAAAPLGATAVQVGTLVKLVRVLMLGPVCLVLALFGKGIGATGADDRPQGLAWRHVLPWFIVGFAAMLLLRGFDCVPVALLPTLAQAATTLTVVSMAALGLGVDIRVVAQAGGRVTATVILSLLGLAGISLLLLRLIPLTGG